MKCISERPVPEIDYIEIYITVQLIRRSLGLGIIHVLIGTGTP